MKVVTIVGARPQFVKAAAVSRAFAAFGVNEVIVHTGQHFDHNMSQVFFDEMEIPVPKYNLDVHGLGHGAMTGRMLEGIEAVLLTEKPDAVLVYGDTNSTLAGALAAKKLLIPVAHVEAGLRSFNMAMPEEVNRILTDRISNWLFCPTDNAIANLKREGFDGFGIEVVKSGDVMQDAAIFYSERSPMRSDITKRLRIDGGFILSTIHRQENTDTKQNIEGIVSALNQLHQEQRVIVPLHPRTKQLISKLDVKPTFEIIDPVGYFDMVELLEHCSVVLTDSGGVQKEAFFFQKPCVTMRNETEWIELVENGFNVLSGADTRSIVELTRRMLAANINFDVDLYGGGKASERIARFFA